ncbi:MAG: asparagine synthase (glutamine-hydrolyzing) [Coriobacteriales bacterium]|nr:asparagine synthase (glutamine-hydrolyzing) [Coriobacteriales bacterium]
MSGIAGYFNYPGNDNLLYQMSAQMAQRGPDGEQTFCEARCGLVYRQLAVVDSALDIQPMHSADQRFVLVMNGALLNCRKLREELASAGHSLTTDSDVEVVLHAFAEWGSAGFDRLDGVWGLAIYDREHKRLTLCRDHFGIKPLYYAVLEDALLFASEIKPLIYSGLIERRVNERSLYRYLNFRAHDDGAETFFAGIQKLLPGQMLEIDEGGKPHISSYTTLREDLLALGKSEHPVSYTPEVAAEYRRRLEESILARLEGDARVGTSLSGGLDSSTVAVLISRLMTEREDQTRAIGPKQNTYSAIFPGQINDEEKYADAAIAVCGDTLAVHKVKPTADEFKLDIIDFIRSQEEPTISTGPYVQYQVMREARKDVRVMLDGQAADETMAGYVPYYAVYLHELKGKGEWGKLIKELWKSLDVLLRLARFKIKDRLSLRKDIPFSTFLTDEFKQAHKSERFSVISDNLRARLLQDLYENSVPALLRYGDRNTMRFSIEGRAPFLDRSLLTFIFSLPNEAIIKNGWNKRILRDSMAGILPDLIAKRRNKIGLSSPEFDWMIRLKNFFYDIFLSEEFANRPYFNQQEVLKAFEGFIQGKNGVGSMPFWRMANVELWLREFFDEPKEPLPVKSNDFEPNVGKKLDLHSPAALWRRYPLHTEQVSADIDLDSFVEKYVRRFFTTLSEQSMEHRQLVTERPWYLFISEKIVAITQGRSYFVWDIKPSWWARTLSRFVTRTPAGIGLGSPYTMHLAIKEVGLPRILFASIAGAIGKLVGKHGLFYELAGADVRAIDGPTEYSVYPANVSAKLPPADPNGVAKRLTERVRKAVQAVITESQEVAGNASAVNNAGSTKTAHSVNPMPTSVLDNFGGVVVMDANDIGRNVLGKNAPGDNARYEAAFADNPLGQAHEQTPICLVFESQA